MDSIWDWIAAGIAIAVGEYLVEILLFIAFLAAIFLFRVGASLWGWVRPNAVHLTATDHIPTIQLFLTSLPFTAGQRFGNIASAIQGPTGAIIRAGTGDIHGELLRQPARARKRRSRSSHCRLRLVAFACRSHIPWRILMFFCRSQGSERALRSRQRLLPLFTRRPNAIVATVGGVAIVGAQARFRPCGMAMIYPIRLPQREVLLRQYGAPESLDL